MRCQDEKRDAVPVTRDDERPRQERFFGPAKGDLKANYTPDVARQSDLK